MEITKQQEKVVEQLAKLHGLTKQKMLENIVDIGMEVYSQVAATNKTMIEDIQNHMKRIRESAQGGR